MRRCFLLPIIPNKTIWAFPAYAGMFPRREIVVTLTTSFPRVCGDVSKEIYAQGTADELSPRMRGCFLVPVTPRYLRGAFPAYAGMFLRKFHLRVLQSGFPRVCGDVSHDNRGKQVKRTLSPRMRGCFRSRRSDLPARSAFPAYAGMFPLVQLRCEEVSGFPRVCGDVSSGTTITNEIRELSPRMRGCFHHAFPTRVE